MGESVDYTELVEQAQLGNQRSLESLTELARGRLCAYLYNLTLDYDLAQDLSQETLLEMVESLKNLKSPDRFWSWLFRTALGKTQLYFRDKRRQHAIRTSLFEEKNLMQLGSSDYDDGLSKLIRMELSEAMFRAMKKLKFSHRNVLTLRCFEQMPYSEIAQIIDCSELQTHALFFRAKHTLKRQLARDGFDKKWLLAALGAFAHLTTPAKAAPATVTAASLKVGLGGTILGAAGTKLGVVVTTAVAVVALTVGGIITVNNNISKAFTTPTHFVTASDPDGDGWKGLEVNRWQRPSIVSADPNEWLVGNSSLGKRAVILPAEHWVELKFPGRIIDGPGDDILLVEFGGQRDRAYVLITDGAGNEYQLGTANVAASEQSGFREIGFDISGISLPFVPQAIRVVGIDTGSGRVPGFELCGVQARVAKETTDITTEETFKYPSNLLKAHDPNGNGWKGGDWKSESNWAVSNVIPEQLLVGPPPSESSGVIIPKGRWIELKFPGRITDGPGDDIIITEFGQYGEQAQVFITDANGNEYLLGTATSGTSGQLSLTEIGFDISDISVPFVPCAVRILALDNKGPSSGFELCNVRARINSH